MSDTVDSVPGTRMGPHSLMEGHSSGPPSPTGVMEFIVTGQFSSRDDTEVVGTESGMTSSSFRAWGIPVGFLRRGGWLQAKP